MDGGIDGERVSRDVGGVSPLYVIRAGKIQRASRVTGYSDVFPVEGIIEGASNSSVECKCAIPRHGGRVGYDDCTASVDRTAGIEVHDQRACLSGERPSRIVQHAVDGVGVAGVVHDDLSLVFQEVGCLGSG